ncbi:beta-lactamase [Streptomyces albus]|uniref:Beta-lactamase n=1 Tax=Streptomyces albus (strain ATCC 21838 / DSM 41398 / FERM P-419 / JCM 4703 / NBRC 107858) TaxID=1081613 RepID=A0A0B5F4A0_STRA4|nr:beta-lactamase [Streptomyces albus]AOU79433.1 beta-lactamase [Streptomyces albus]AYN35159.1 beta-lactamase [Streptomyces albus]
MAPSTNPRGLSPSRRTLLGLGAGTALAAAVSLASAGSAAAGTAGVPGGGLSRELRALEGRFGARLGVFARNAVTGASVRYRAGETFPICSTFKTLATAAVLRDLDQNGEFLAKTIRYTAQEVEDSGYGPITGEPENLAHGMSVEALCAAAVSYSDNAAANLLLRELGGPRAVTRFCRSLGDPITRLDRWEPELNSAEPWRTTDLTTPAEVGLDYGRLVLGKALPRGDRELLTGWLRGNTTGDARLRAGLPEDWTVADKTGTGEYGTTNDVGIAWTGDGTPLILSVLATQPDPEAPAVDALIAETARLLVPALV